MFRLVAFVLLACLTGVPVVHGAGRESANVAPAALLKRVSPRYPAKAIDRGQEGWVDLIFTVTPEGTTSDIHVIAAYPRGVFERSAANALSKWSYSPRIENGIAIPQANNRAVLSFALSERAFIRPALVPLYATASSQIGASNWPAAERTLEEIAETYGLSLFELGALEQLRGRAALGMHNYKAAVDNFTRALSITGRFDPTARAGISQMLVTAAIHAREFDRAVEVFDAWHPSEGPQTRELRRTIEAIRAARAAGRDVEITPPR